MNKKHGLCCILLGTVLLIAAVSLVFYNTEENKKSGEAAREVLTELKAMIPEPPTESPDEYIIGGDLFSEYATEAEPATEDATMMVDEHGYIGIIAIPDLGIELPVMSDWNYQNLYISPCRYKGSIAGKDIIIAAHNYWSHFGTLSSLGGGEELYFTTVDGVVHTYEVLQITEINGKDIAGMDFGSANVWDMTLFTCTLGGQSRVTVRCREITKEN